MSYTVKCSYCNKNILKSNGRYNEEKKFGWKRYCSLKCLGLSRRKREIFMCSWKECNKTFTRKPSDSKKSKYYYCSHSCCAFSNNTKRKLKPKQKCKICDNFLKHGKIYCSPQCQQFASTRTKEEIIILIQKFCKINGRIPLKIEFKQSTSARKRFGTWNKAVVAAGLDPNPVLFSKKNIANDGHICDSFSEKIIDDWLFRRKIKHKINFPYPNNEKYTVDFVVGNYWIEFFGLSGESKRYDFLKRKKIRIAKKLNLNLIKLYPKDLFPKGNLNLILKELVS